MTKSFLLHFNLCRAGHTYAQVAPYAKSVAEICTPLFSQYGTFNTGKTTLLTAISALHGIKHGKVQRKYMQAVIFGGQICEF